MQPNKCVKNTNIVSVISARETPDLAHKPIIFLGPSLQAGAAKEILDADYRPPARRGDLVAAARESPPVIGLIDGVFLASLPPSPLEVLEVLRGGTTVMGASSLGALRAVELEPHGMVGIGKIFAMYRRKLIIADDEVALVFSGEDLRPLSEPLVNIRYGLSAARRAGFISVRERQCLIRIARDIYFAERSWPLVFHSAKNCMDLPRLNKLAAFIDQGDFDLKRKDAIQLLQVVGSFLTGERPA
jgi:hypothetical protein